MKKVLTLLVIAAFALTLFTGCKTVTASAENYVGIDMAEAGVQFVVDENNEVLSFSASTVEGEEVIIDEDYVGEDVNDAIEDVIENGAELGYVDPEATEENPSDVLVTTEPSNPKVKQAWKEEMLNAVDTALQNNGFWGVVLPAEDIEEINALATQYNLTPAQVRIVLALQLTKPELTFEEAAEKSPSWFIAMLRAGKPVKAQIQVLKDQKATLEAELATLDTTADAARIAEINTELQNIDTKLAELETLKNNAETFKAARKEAHKAAVNQWKNEKQARSENVKKEHKKGNPFTDAVKNDKKAQVGNRFKNNKG